MVSTREQRKRWRDKYPEKVREQRKRWKAKYPEKLKEQKRRYLDRKLKNKIIPQL